MRIAFIIGTGGIGGAETQMVRIAREFQTKGHQPFVIMTSDAGPMTEYLRASGIRWSAGSKPNPARWTGALRAQYASQFVRNLAVAGA